MKVVVLAGGLGTRLAEETEDKPKPMVEIGGRPILWHIMSTYAHHGFSDFVIALGFRGDVIKRYFLNLRALNSDITVDLANGEVTTHRAKHANWKVALIDTGVASATGGRLKNLAPQLRGGTFMMTYGDGVADIDIGKLVAFHRAHGKLVTVTAVRPPARFGGLDLEGDRVSRFTEKVEHGETWINGGFFVVEPAVLDRIEGESTPWESAPLEGLAAEGELMAYRHAGYWQPMDTLREKKILERLWQSGQAPWKVWQE